MDIKQYLKESEKTFSGEMKNQNGTLLHGAIGITGEAAELMDQIKKHVFYGKDLDLVNIQEELGDIMFFVSVFLREFDLDIEQILSDNIEKLRKRYGEKFDTGKALNRNISEELKHYDNTKKIGNK